MKNLILGATLALGAALFSQQASAISFNFSGSSSADAVTRTFTQGGLSVDVTAGIFSAFGNPTNITGLGGTLRQVDQNNLGLGADGPIDNGQIDGALGNDVLVFSFSQEVRIESISFANVDGNDDFAFGSVDGNSFTRFVNFQDVTNPILASSFLTLGQRTGGAFGIGAIGTFDNFRVSGIEVTAVPVPAAGLLLGSALLGFGYLRRRRQREA